MSSMNLQSFDSHSRLEELGVSESALLAALQQGLFAFLSATVHHPRPTPGTNQWSESVRALRDQLVPMGWKSYLDDGREGVISPSKKLVILPLSGDEATGREGISPSNKRAKGPASKAMIAANLPVQAILLDRNDYLPPERRQTGKPSTWVLLYHRDPLKSELRAELSKPIGINSDGFFDEWRERILLPPIPFDEDPTYSMAVNDYSLSAPEINIEIRKRD